MRITLEELGHKQSPIPISIDNTTTVGIVNNTIKRQKSRSMEMRYFWLLDQEAQKMLTPQDRKILEIFLPRITLGTYINIADHITSICQTHHGIYRGPWNLRHGEGVLKYWETRIASERPCPVFQWSVTQVPVRVSLRQRTSITVCWASWTYIQNNSHQ